ncbi:reverse transcriptase domain-containing protein, partial [Vibrio parahaemolyticus]|nr:reverse transcriptase domain-containing protein [Vibrio parahaemolyticus]
RSQVVEGVRFGDGRISSQLFEDDVVLLAQSNSDLQLSLGRFAAECEAAGMRISTSKSEAMVLSRKRVDCPLQVRGEVLPQVEEFKYLGILFTSEGRMVWCGVCSDVLDCRGEEGAEPEGKAFDLTVHLRPNPHLWS